MRTPGTWGTAGRGGHESSSDLVGNVCCRVSNYLNSRVHGQGQLVNRSWATSTCLQTSVCVWITTWVKSKDLTWLRWVGAHSIYVDIYNLPSWLLEFSLCMSYKLLNMSLHSKLAFCKNLPISCIVVSWTKTWVACEYIQSTHWLATGYLIDQAWENRSSKKSSLETIMRTRTFPVRMPVGLRQMAWVQVIDEDFRCDDILKTWP